MGVKFKYLWMLFWGILLGNNIFSQRADSIASEELSYTYYNDVSHKLMFNVKSLMRSYDLNILNVGTEEELQISPLGQMNLGIGGNYKWLGIAFNFGLPSSTKDVEKYGETKKQDLHIGMYGNQASGFINLQRYKGFHLSNYIDTLTGNQVKLPSMETYSINFSGLYFINHDKFSFKAAYVRNAIQNKSAGSLVVGAYLTYDASTSDVPLGNSGIPDSIQNQFDVLAIWSRTFGISVGYTYTWVIGKGFFLNGTFVPGLGGKKIRLTLSNNTADLDAGISLRLDANVAMGYEADNWLAGITASTLNQFYEIEGLVISPTSTSVRIFVAKRFEWPKKKKK